MSAGSSSNANVKQVVPFLRVSDIERSLGFYGEGGLGFTVRNKWVVEGKLRWCWLELGGAALMLQEFSKASHDSWTPSCKVGEGVTLCFTCEDAVTIYHEARERGLEASEPQVGNAMWVTCLSDPDGYRLDFESPTDTQEDTKLSEVQS